MQTSFKIRRTLSIVIFFLFQMPLHGYYKRPGYEAIQVTGDYIQIALPLTAITATLCLKDFTGSLQFAETFGTTLAVVFILKPMINERRPDTSGLSFPSGHTAAAFSGAGFLQIRYGWPYGIPAYLLAAYVGFSRVYCYKHWTRDVIGGAAIGMAANVLFTRPYKEKCRIKAFLNKDSGGILTEFDF